jgi:hypothetical protein
MERVSDIVSVVHSDATGPITNSRAFIAIINSRRRSVGIDFVAGDGPLCAYDRFEDLGRIERYR